MKRYVRLPFTLYSYQTIFFIIVILVLSNITYGYITLPSSIAFMQNRVFFLTAYLYLILLNIVYPCYLCIERLHTNKICILKKIPFKTTTTLYLYTTQKENTELQNRIQNIQLSAPGKAFDALYYVILLKRFYWYLLLLTIALIFIQLGWYMNVTLVLKMKIASILFTGSIILILLVMFYCAHIFLTSILLEKIDDLNLQEAMEWD